MMTHKGTLVQALRGALRFTSVALTVGMFSPPALSANRTWGGGAGPDDPFWDLAANWNSGLPLAFDRALLGAFNTTIRSDTWALQSLSGTGTLTMNGGALSYEAASSVGGLVLSLGSLGGKGTLATNSLVWTRGNLGNAASLNGTVNVNGTSTLLASSGRAIDFGQALNLNGNANWSGYGGLEIYGAGGSGGGASRESSFNVSSGRTLNLQGTGSNESTGYFFEGFGTLNNAGTITKTGTNALSINSNFNNTGTLNVNGGETRFGGIRTLGGTVNVASGATLRFDGYTTFDPAATIGGGGNLIFEGVYSVVASGTRTFSGGGTKTLALGNLGGAGTMVFNRLIWAGGSMGFSDSLGGTTTVTGTTTLTTPNAAVNYGRRLNLNGDASWAGAGTMNIAGPGTYAGIDYGESVVSLAAGKTFSLHGDAGFHQIEGAGTFRNAGTVTKTGASTLYIYSVFDNTGILHANGGRIEVAALAQWNATTKALTGGTYSVTGNQPIVFALGYAPGTSIPAVITTNRAKIYLDGADAAILSSPPDSLPDVNALRVLAANRGVLSITGGATLDIARGLGNNGTGSLIVGSGSALTLSGGNRIYKQSGTASTFVGGTLTANSITIDAGSLSAGNGAGLVGNGVLNASIGGVTFSAASRFDQDMTTAAWDRFSVATGNVVLDGTLQANFGEGVETVSRRILTAVTGQVSGSFDSVVSNLDPSQYTVSVIYGANYVNLRVRAVPFAGMGVGMPSASVSAVPEPRTYVLLATGLALLGWKLRRRQAARASA